MITVIKEGAEKYKTCDLSQKYEFIGLTKEHIKRLNNVINILESLNEHTDAKYIKEIKDKLLEVKEVKEVDLDNELDFVKDAYYYFTSDERSSIKKVAKHFFELGLKAEKGETL